LESVPIRRGSRRRDGGPEPRSSAPVGVEFERGIVPILRDSYLTCHGPAKQKGHFRLDEREPALRGGDDGPAIVPGDRSHRPLFGLLHEKDPGTRMPQKRLPLPSEQIELPGRWIDQGASWPDGIVVR
ncbi:MAG TPA: c-type cytochrome domain-containing protein, partial [Planctomycetota bacterium]|nr:c-type cytochrome domain-containing protein [Planctomycetota bacterium]